MGLYIVYYRNNFPKVLFLVHDMINIRQSQTNTVSISSLESLVTIPNPVFIFKWVDSYNYTLIKSFLDQSAYPERYSEFIVTDGSDLTFKASGHCYIYESPVDASAIDPSTMNLLTSEQYTFIPIAIADYVYEPSLYTYNAVDTVFDPQFNTNTPSPTYILHDDLSGRTNPDNHPQYIKEASLGNDFVWNNGVLDVSGGSGGSGGTDASVSELYDFYEDLSTYAHTQDASIADLYSEIENIPQDASISDLYSKKADKTEIYSKTYIDGSLNAKQPAGTYLGPNDAFTSAYNESGDAKIFNSITLPNLSARSINASEGIQLIETANEIYIGVNSTIARTFQLSGLASETYVQQSLYPYATNASIGSAGFAKQNYVDASLNAKQDLIPEGTYLKEASLGTGLVWNGGQLDVSVEGGSGAQDASIGELFIYVEDLSTLVHDETQDPSIVDLYETAIFGTASAGTGEVLLNVVQYPGTLPAIKCSTLTAGTGVTFDISYGGVFGTDVDNITINASVGVGISSLSYLNDVSIVSISDKDALIYDASISKWKNVPTTDISSLYYERIYIDGSLNAKVNRTLFDSSLLSITNNDLSQDASILLRPLTTYVDGSLNLKMNIIDVSTTYLKINDASSNYAKRLTYFTTVNASTYLVNPSDNLNIIQCDTSTVITFPDTLEAGFSTTVMLNVSTGYVTLNASTFRATDASVRLKDMYAAATVVHQGSGIFFGFGNLK
jgi:hypothetical protein